MKKQLHNILNKSKRGLYVLLAIAMVLGVSPAVVQAAIAGGQVQSRSIKISDNGASGGTITSGIGSGTNVTYRVSFIAASSYTMKSVVVDFCGGTGGTPFIGDSACAAPPNFTVGTTPNIDTSDYDDNTAGTSSSSTANYVHYNGLGTSANWTASSLNSGQTFYMTNSTGVSITAGSKYTFAITGITNPSQLGSFYGRLITYSTTAGATAYTHDLSASASSTYQDYGGFALSIAQIVKVTARVQETLTFCVSGYSNTAGTPSSPTTGVAPSDCGDTTEPSIILGHGQNKALDTSVTDTNNIWTLTSTNALNGVSIRMHNSNTCGGLSADNGTTCPIAPASSGSGGTITAITPGQALFGMHCTDGTGGSGSLLCDPNYNDTDATHYGMDNTTIGDNVTSTYGDQVAASTAPLNSVTNKFTFAASAANITPAAIYTANLAMIATGTF